MLLRVVECLTEQFAIHTHLPRQQVSRLLETQPGVAEPFIHTITEQFLEFTKRTFLRTTQQDIELTPTLTRLTQRGENAMGGEGAVIDSLDIIRCYGCPLTTHLRDEIIEQTSFAE